MSQEKKRIRIGRFPSPERDTSKKESSDKDSGTCFKSPSSPKRKICDVVCGEPPKESKRDICREQKMEKTQHTVKISPPKEVVDLSPGPPKVSKDKWREKKREKALHKVKIPPPKEDRKFTKKFDKEKEVHEIPSLETTPKVLDADTTTDLEMSFKQRLKNRIEKMMADAKNKASHQLSTFPKTSSPHHISAMNFKQMKAEEELLEEEIRKHGHPSLMAKISQRVPSRFDLGQRTLAGRTIDQQRRHAQRRGPKLHVISEGRSFYKEKELYTVIPPHLPSRLGEEPEPSTKFPESYKSLLWERPRRSSQELNLTPSREEAFDFFTQNWDEKPEEELLTTASEDSKEVGYSDKDYRGLTSDRLETISFLKASYIGRTESWNLESRNIFFPSRSIVPVSAILVEEEPRVLESEGLYVGPKPSLPTRHRLTIESRLFHSEGTKWFGPDGQLITADYPFCTISFHHLRQPPKSIPELDVVFVRPLKTSAEEEAKVRGEYRLVLNLLSIQFSHHPLFSREHVLASQLSIMVQEYSRLTRPDSPCYIDQKLKALRSAMYSIKKDYEKEDDDNKQNKEKLKEKMIYYEKQIKQLRTLRDAREAEEKTLVKRITETWKEIKNLRQFQNYVNTPIKLLTKKEPKDRETEERKREEEILEELEDHRTFFERKYKEQLKNYTEQMKKYNETRRQRSEAKRREKRRKAMKMGEAVESGEKEILENTEEDDKHILESPKPSEPEMPASFEEEACLAEIRARSADLRKNPGDPSISFMVENRVKVTPTSECGKMEQARRAEVAKRRFGIKIYYNDKYVCQTPSRSLEQDFTVKWEELYTICIIYWPAKFTLQIYEGSVLGLKFLTELYLPLPDPSLTSAIPLRPERHHFNTEDTVPPKGEAVGSGINFGIREDTDHKVWLLTGGEVVCTLAWTVDEEGNIKAPPISSEPEPALLRLQQQMEMPPGSLPSPPTQDLEKLIHWVETSHLDPNHPDNSQLLATLKEFELQRGVQARHPMEREEKPSGAFRLDKAMALFDFATLEKLNNNLRFQLLTLRAQGHLRAKNFAFVPSFEEEIPKEVFKSITEKKEEKKRPVPTTHLEMMEEKRNNAIQILTNIRERLAHELFTSRCWTLSDIVYEEQIPTIKTLSLNLATISYRKRPLYPSRKKRKALATQAPGLNLRILVTVLRALSVPIRADPEASTSRPLARTRGGEVLGESLVRPFVEVTFQRVSMRTNTAEGPHPVWNEEISIPFKVPNEDYSVSKLERVNGCIFFHLFDEMIVDLLEDERERDTTIHERLERRWLGGCRLPFSTLYFNSRVEGTFRLETPPFLLGYEQENNKQWTLMQESTHNTYLSLFITLEPALKLPSIIGESFKSDEPERILHEMDRWAKNLATKYPQRNIKTAAIDLSGRRVFIPRYLHPLQPPDVLLMPPSINESRSFNFSTEEIVARFVSLIPSSSDTTLLPSMCNIWGNNQQLLNTLRGTAEEHAILLCNLFLGLKKKAYLVLGWGLPAGESAFVLTFEDNNVILLWDPTTGYHVPLKESHTPLQRLGCLANPHNIWANIQKTDDPTQLSFDLTKSQHWKAFFPTPTPKMESLPSIQPDRLEYTLTDPLYVQQLTERIETILRDAIMRWRRHRSRTIWNRLCIQAFRKILPKLEENLGTLSTSDSPPELDQILLSYKLAGFPLSLGYRDIESLKEAVYSTGVHSTEERNVEFALAVYIHPYPCNVLAVWIYVASLVKKR